MTTATVNRFTEEVARGAAWLDEQQPDWRDRIDLAELDLANPCLCVLGQVFDDAAKEASKLSPHVCASEGYWFALDHFDTDWVWAREHGFYLSPWEADARSWHVLQDAWIAVIEAGR